MSVSSLSRARFLVLAGVASLVLSSSIAHADDAPPPVPVDDPAAHRFRFAAVPTATFNTDEGFGTGGVGTMYHLHEGVLPYRDAVTLNVFVSSKLVQAHALTWDAIRPFGVPGRSYARIGYYSTLSQNYCGVGSAVTCAPGDAIDAARAAGLSDDDEASADFVRRYHLMRFQRPYATLIVRPWLRDKPWRVEALLGWRGAWTIPGDLSSSTPWPGSLYAQDHPDGEPGVSSVPFVGVVVDNRDVEIFPTQGLYAEASVRAAQPWTGATWRYVGGNAIVAGFVPVVPVRNDGPRVVLASRGILDVLSGAPSTEELARIGGTLDTIAFGGSTLGRGIREHRYLGKLKLLAQSELRAQLWDVDVLGEHFSLGAAVFSDVGWVGFDVGDLRGNPAKLLATGGVSWRILWGDNFAIRWDLAFSPDEREGPGFYIIVGQPF